MSFFTRRRLLAASLAPRRRALSIGVMDGIMKLGSRPESVRKAAELGFEGLQVTLGRGNAPFRENPALAREFASEAKAARLPVVSTYIDTLHQFCLKQDREAVAYAVVAEISRCDGRVQFHLPHGPSEPGGQSLAIVMTAADGSTRGLIYPIRRSAGRLSFGQPVVTDEETTDWCPVGNPWANPYCKGDIVRFRPRDRAVDPSTPLWHSIVELTRLRIHEDQPNAEEYMSFLDDLRNGIFVVAGRPSTDSGAVHLRPRTVFNPLGTLTVEASRLTLVEGPEAGVVPVVR